MAQILVTGGEGYIGRHLCKLLNQQGHLPLSLDDLSRSHFNALRFGPFIKARVHDKPTLVQALREHKIQAVIHLAAFAYVEESTRRPHLYFENNINGLYWLLEAMKEAQVKRLVFSSSCAVYGKALTPVIDESHPTLPINPYGLSKLICEELITNTPEVNACSLRYFNVGGADPESELKEEHDPEPHILPNLIRAAKNNEPVTLFGKDHPTRDGTCIRDFIHVWDLARAHLNALEALLSKSPIRPTYNLGGERGHSLLELVKACEKLFSTKIPINWKPARRGDPPQLVASSQTFQNDFDWSPELSDLKTLIQTADL